jgi:serine protease Do
MPTDPKISKLIAGDVIHALNRFPVITLADLKTACGKLKEGDPFVVQIEREGKMIYIDFEESPSPY